MEIISIVCGAVVGLSLGLTGSGGSILAIPLLVYGLGLPVSQAVVVSLLMVSIIAFLGAVRQSFGSGVNWRVAILFSVTGMLISPVVIQLSYHVDESLRLVLFSGLMLFVSYHMAFNGRRVSHDNLSEISAANKQRRSVLQDSIKISSGGALAGALSGFFGVGGGFVIVPLLTLIFKMPYPKAVGTSLACIFLISMAAVGGAFVKGVEIDWQIFANFIGGGVIGMMVGSTLVNRIPHHIAKIIFAVLTACFAVFMLIDKLYIH